MQTYFNIRYEFNKESVQNSIARQVQTGGADYICVADGVIPESSERRNVQHLRQQLCSLVSEMDLRHAL